MSTRRLAVATLLTGIIAGLVGLACIHLLHWIQAIAWAYVAFFVLRNVPGWTWLSPA